MNCVLAGVAVVIGGIIGGGEISPASWELLLPAFLVAALVAGGGNAINDYFDREIDKINRPNRPIPSGKIGPTTALWIAAGLFTAGLLISLVLKNPYCSGIAGLNSIVLIAYAGKLKRVGLPGNLAIGYLVGSTFLFGGVALRTGGPLVSTQLWILVLMAALSTVARELIKDIEDIPGDRKLGLRTFPLTHGAKKTALMAAAFIGLTIFLSPLPYLEEIFGWFYLLPLLVSIGFFLSGVFLILSKPVPEQASRASLTFKLGMGFGLLAFLAGMCSA